MKNWCVEEMDKNLVNTLSKEYALPVFTAMLLTIRGITAREQIEDFFSVSPQLADPMEINDMDKAVSRIRQALDENEKICIYGDYDCDGVTSTVILYSYFESCGADVSYYIPDRITEGYGMNQTAVRKLEEQGVRLIVTVDNGIAAAEEIRLANSLGIDVVVTDHHTPSEELPPAAAVVDPHRADEKSSYHDYCGAGLALMLIAALEGESYTAIENYADLAALGTIADIVPLTGENRKIVKAGLSILDSSDRPGIYTLVEQAGVSQITAGTVGFRLAPRINAAGRLSTADHAVQLLLTEDEDVAAEKAELLCSLNGERQSIESDIAQQIIDRLTKEKSLTYSRVIVVSSENWNAGVIGIAASRITEQFGKPTIIISEDGDICKGSGRSVEGFSLIDGIFACGEYLEKFGGHPMAAGFSIKKENIGAFARAINEYALQNYDYMPPMSLHLDCWLNPATINLNMVHQLKAFEPFGSGNPKPVFGLKNMKLEKVTPVGGGKHLKLTASREQGSFQLMYFFCTADQFPYQVGDVLDFAVTLDINHYQGTETLSFMIREIRLSGYDTQPLLRELQDYELYKNGVFRQNLKRRSLTRKEFAAVYTWLRAHPAPVYAMDALAFHLQPEGVDGFQLLMILDILSELNLIRCERKAFLLQISLCAASGKVDLKSSGIYQKLEEDIHYAG